MTTNVSTAQPLSETLSALKEVAREIDIIADDIAGCGLRSDYNYGRISGLGDAGDVVLNMITRIENTLPACDREQPLPLTINGYQLEALSTAIYKHPVIYPTIGLAGEAGEVSDKVKKVLRDHDSDFKDDDIRRGIALELGDVLWYVATLARDLGFTLQEVATLNINKLRSRAERGKLSGSGDER